MTLVTLFPGILRLSLFDERHQSLRPVLGGDHLRVAVFLDVQGSANIDLRRNLMFIRIYVHPSQP